MGKENVATRGKKWKTGKSMRVLAILIILMMVCVGCGMSGGNTIEGTYTHTGSPGSAIIIEGGYFSWYMDAFGGYYQIEDSPYTVDEENSLLIVEDSEFPFYYETDEYGNIVWIARLVNGVTQEKHYK